jgi:cell division GTPase FtsZ
VPLSARQGVKSITDIITVSGLVNVDFADVRSIMCNSGTGILGTGVSTGKNRAEEAALVRTLNPRPLCEDPKIEVENAVLVLFASAARLTAHA